MNAGAARETVVVTLRPHSRALFWPNLLLIVVAGGVGFAASFTAEQWQLVALLVAAGLLVITGWFVPLSRWLSRRYTITTRRVVVRSGVVVRSRQELLHSRAHDVTVRRGALQAAFRSGDVILNSGQNNPVVLKDVPSADLVQEALHDLIEAAQRAATEPRPEADQRG